MINMTAKEFDKRFDEGTDIFDIMEPDEVLSMKEFQNRLLTDTKQKQITITLDNQIFSKIEQKANLLNLDTIDMIRVLLARDVGVL
jgi:hypothetical protein